MSFPVLDREKDREKKYPGKRQLNWGKESLFSPALAPSRVGRSLPVHLFHHSLFPM